MDFRSMNSSAAVAVPLSSHSPCTIPTPTQPVAPIQHHQQQHDQQHLLQSQHQSSPLHGGRHASGFSVPESQMDTATSSTNSMHQQALAAATAYAAAAAYAGLDPMVAAHQRVKAYYDHWASSLFGSLAANPTVTNGSSATTNDYSHPVNNRVTDWSINSNDRGFESVSSDSTSWMWPRDQTCTRNFPSTASSRTSNLFDVDARPGECAATDAYSSSRGASFSDFSTSSTFGTAPNLPQQTSHPISHRHPTTTIKDPATDYGLTTGHPGYGASAYANPVLPHLSHPDPYRQFHPGLDYSRFGTGPSSHEPRINGWS